MAMINDVDMEEFETNSNVILAEMFKKWCNERGFTEPVKDWTSVGVFGYSNGTDYARMRWSGQ